MYIYTKIYRLRKKLKTKKIPSLTKKKIRIRIRIKEKLKIKKSLFLSQIYTDLVAMRATLRELTRIIIYNIHFF